MNKRWNKIKKISTDMNIPTSYVKKYGIKFLKSNPLVVESIKIFLNLTGKFSSGYLDEETIKIRKDILNKE